LKIYSLNSNNSSRAQLYISTRQMCCVLLMYYHPNSPHCTLTVSLTVTLSLSFRLSQLSDLHTTQHTAFTLTAHSSIQHPAKLIPARVNFNE